MVKISDSHPKKWLIDPHTKAKHEMLGAYLDGLYPTLSTYEGKLIYFDGFAGRGRYTGGEEGSPLIAIRRLVTHSYFPQLSSRKFVFLFVEADAENYESLSDELEDLRKDLGGWPKNVAVDVANERFDQTATTILDYLAKEKAKMAPMLAFVDPFGYSGLPIDLLARFVAFPKSEVFVNFMVGHLMRFIERDGQEAAVSSLYGMSPKEVMREFKGDDRIQHLAEVYKQQLEAKLRYKYVRGFRMVVDSGNVGYYLFHGTNHIKGLELMKNAMWKIDPNGTFTFSDRDADQSAIAIGPDISRLKQELVDAFSVLGSPVGTPTIYKYGLEHTDFRRPHVTTALRELEKAGDIDVNRPTKRSQFSDAVTVQF